MSFKEYLDDMLMEVKEEHINGIHVVTGNENELKKYYNSKGGFPIVKNKILIALVSGGESQASKIANKLKGVVVWPEDIETETNIKMQKEKMV